MIYIATDNYKDGFPLSKAYDDTIYQKGNGEYYLKFRFPVDRFGIWKHLTCETILKADDTRGLQLFKIKKINKINGYIRVYCKHISDDLNYIGVDKLSVTNATGRRVMEALAGSTTEQHNFIFNSDVATMHTLNLSNTTAGKILSKDKHSIIGQWGGELVRDNFLVDLKARAGVDTEILFMNKKNVKNLDNVISTENLITRLKLSVETEYEGKKQTITATVDSPNINAYPRIYTNYLKVTNNNITTQEELIEYGKKYFRDKLVDFPTDNLTVNVIDKNQEQVRLFDTVWFRNIDFNIDKRLKVVAYEYSPMAKRYKKISFGALKVSNLSQIKSLSQLEDKIEEKVNESFVDAFKIQKNLSELLKLDRKAIEDKMSELEEKSKGAVEVKRALFEADGTIPDVVKTKILDAVEGDIGRLKTIITEAELIKAIQAKLNFAEIKNALIDKAFINQIISDEKFTQQFEEGQVTTQNIFTKLKDSIKSNILKEVVTKDGVRKIVNDLTVDADGIRQITQEEIIKRREELKGKNSYIHTRYSDNANGSNFDTNSNRKYIGVYTGDKEQAPTNPSEYSWTKLKSDGRLYKAYANSLTGLDFTLIEPDENAMLFAKNRPRVNIVNDNDISDIWQANMFLSFKANTKYTLTARAKGNSNKLWAYFRNNKTNAQYNWGQLEFRGLETKSVTFTTTNDVDDVLFKFVLVPEDEDWTGVQIDWFTIYEGDKRYSDYPVNEPAQYHKYRYFGYVFKEGQPIASDFDWFDLQQTSITNDKYTHIVYSDNADGSNFGREPKKYMGVARTTSPTQPTNKTAYKWFKMKGDDGVSSYIHRKYSDNANGSPMSDNSNLKYIGIYTGTSATAPTTPTSYTWSKIKGEDGAQGVPGARGSDGRTSYLHTAYSNSATGDRDFSTTNSNGKEYIGTYSDFEINDSNDYRRYKWVKIKGENGRDGNNGRDGRNGDSYTRNYLSGTADEKVLTAVNDNFVTQEAFKLVDNKNFRDLGFVVGDKVTFIADYEVLPNGTNKKISKLNFEWYDDNRYRYWMNQDINPTKGTFTRTITANNDLLDSKRAFLRTDNVNAKIKITNARVIKGDTVQPWSIAQEDLQGHTLTANVRFEGTYINNVTNNLKVFLDVYYDGRKIALGFNAQIKYKGGNRSDWSGFWNANVDSTGRITNIDWGNREQNGEPIDVIVLVTYKDKDAIASARTDNTPNIGELKETIQRYKTFESTLSEFRSEIGYVKETTQILGDTVPDILKDSRTQTGNDVYFDSATPLKANTWYTIIADISGLKSKQETGIYGASGNTSKPIMNSRNFWVVKYPSEQNRVNFYPLGINTTINNVKVYEGDFTETLQGNLYVTHTIHPTENKWLIIRLNKKLEYKDIVLYFDVDGDVNGKSFRYSNAISNFDQATDVDFPLKNKDNVVSVAGFGNSAIILTFNYANPTIKNVRVYEVDYAFRKLTKTQTQNIGTVFKQSAEDIIIAWNNYNKYFSFNNETLDIFEKDSYQNKYKKISLTSEGLKIYNNNTLIGTIGTFTHLGQSFRQNTLDIVLTDDTKAFGVYTWQDFSAFGSQVTGYAPLFEIKKDNSGTYRSYFTQPLQTRAVYIDGLNVAENGTSYVGGITKTINVGGRNLRFVQGILVSG
jgi:phage minor structural protein